MKQLLFLCFIWIAASCGPIQESPKYRIGFSQCVTGDAWRKAMHEEMYRELSFYPELSLTIKDAKGDNSLQIQQIREFMEEGVDLLIVSPNESAPITPIVEEAFNLGIPVIVVDRKITSNQYSAYVGGDNYEVGLTAGQYIRNLMEDKGQILEIWGLEGSSPAIERHQGLMAALEGSEIDLTVKIRGEWEKDTAKNRLKEYLLEEDPNTFDLVLGHNDVMAIGAYEVLQSKGVSGKQFIGIDALPGPYGGIQAVSDQVLNATFFYPTGGDQAIEVAYQILSGLPFDKQNILQTAAVDSSNVKIMKLQTDKIIDQQSNILRQKERIGVQLEIYHNQRTFLFGFGLTLFIAIISLAYVFKSLREKQEINEELKDKNKEISEQKDKIVEYSEKAEIATQQKFEFFTNISHEFRTPLTLIQGPIEDLLHHPTTGPFKGELKLIKMNTNRLLRLVNQLMDIRKLDNQRMKLNVRENDLIPFLEMIMASFKPLAQKRNITFRLLTEDKNLKVWFDPMMMDKVMFNLLSNAFKFTPDRGSILIKIRLQQLENSISIVVEDTGTGMDAETAEHVFERFYQGKNNAKSGTGIGLALSKELVHLHQGSIKVHTSIHEGTQFVVNLLLGHSHFQDTDKMTGESQLITPEEMNFEEEDIPSTPVIIPEDALTLLIIEDDEAIRKYMSRQLSKTYHILEAESIDAGIAKALDQLPDLITCDLMVQKQSGYEAIQRLKNDVRTSHIPIIVITAKGEIEDKIEGIRQGVDDYISKPFSMVLLSERIKMILANRQKLREHYLHQLPIERSLDTSSSPDKKFISEFTAVVEQHCHHPSFSVNDIAEKVGLSRGQLYRKTKAMLGYTVNEYINKVRLKKAKHLLLNSPEKAISEIAFMVGFTSSAYFSTAFKNHYAITPSEFRDKNLK